jgi:hypothetical protein
LGFACLLHLHPFSEENHASNDPRRHRRRYRRLYALEEEF